MDQIIAGRFPTKTEADVAAACMADYVATNDICIFHNNAPGQHGVHPGGGDEHSDPGAREAESPHTSAAAGLTAGAIGTVVAGPLVGLAAAGVAAYTGALLGVLNDLGNESDSDEKHDRRPAGIILAVRIADQASENRIINALQSQGAVDIEKADGKWWNGEWMDFDPIAPPKLVAANEIRSE